MKKFRFRLQPILDLREEQEEAAQRGYATALAASDRAAGALRMAVTELESHWRAMKDSALGGARIAEFQALRRYSTVLEERIRRRERELQAATKALQQAEDRLRKASQQRQTMEKLHERQRVAFDFERVRLEQKQMDEFAGSATTLRSSGLSYHSAAIPNT